MNKYKLCNFEGTQKEGQNTWLYAISELLSFSFGRAFKILDWPSWIFNIRAENKCLILKEHEIKDMNS